MMHVMACVPRSIKSSQSSRVEDSDKVNVVMDTKFGVDSNFGQVRWSECNVRGYNIFCGQ